MENCMNCKIPIEQKTVREKKFCSDKCRARFNMRKRYNRLKNDEDFKKKNRADFKKWYESNKEKHKIRMRIYMREYYRKNYSKHSKPETGTKTNSEFTPADKWKGVYG